MSILEDLDLLDLPDDLPDDLDFDLDDILSEYSTPGLYAAPRTPVKAAPAKATPAPVQKEAAAEPAREEVPEIVLQTPPAAEPTPIVPAAAEDEEDDVKVYRPVEKAAEVPAAPAATVVFDAVEALPAAEAEEVPAEEATEVEAEEASDGTLVFDAVAELPKEAPAAAATEGETLVFSAVEELPVVEAPVQAAPAKKPGLLQRLGALFSKKKAPQAPTTAPVELPAVESDLQPSHDDDLSVLMETELYFEMQSEKAAARRADVARLAEESRREEAALAAEPLWDGEEVEIPDIPAADEAPEIIFSDEDMAALGFAPEKEEVPEIIFTDEAPVMAEETPVLTEEDPTVPAISLEKPEEATSIEDLPVFDLDAELSMAETLRFEAVADAPQPLSEPAPTAAAKPGFLQKLGALLPKRKSKKPAPVVPAAPPADEAAHSLLFSSDMDDELSVLMEAELYAAFAAEEEARQAEAAARQAQLDAQRQAELEARVQAEMEARQTAEAEAALLDLQEADLAAQQKEEAELEAMAENELFAWIETSSGYRKRQELAEAAEQEALEAELAAQAEAQEAPTYETPVYDAAAAMLDQLPVSDEDAAPQLELDLSEEGAEDSAALLEAPDIEPEGEDRFSETPEEMAARIAREDDELHYVPEEGPVKTILSAISKKFSGAFSAFTEQGSGENAEQDEDLGLEVEPTKAYRHFSRHISDYRFRLHVSAALCVVIAWISLGLPVFGSLKNPAVAAAMCLMIQLTVMLTGADILAVGVRSILRKQPGLNGLVALSCAASILDAVVIILSGGKGGYLPFCAVSAISMCFAIYGSLLYCRSQRLNFKTLEQSDEPLTISVDYGVVEPETTSVYRSPGHPEGYIHRSEEEDLSETVYGIIAPILMVAIPVMSLLSALISKSMGDFFHIMAGMFAAAASFSAMVAFPLPYFLVQRDLYAAKAAIAGWTGTREIGRVSSMIVNDRDLFPDETVSIKTIGIVDEVPPQLTLSYACSLIKKSDSCLLPAFLQLADDHDCPLYDVENFQCHETGGLSCEIGPDHVVMASHSYMKLQGLRLPIPRKKSENSLFLAVNGHVIAYFTMEYKAIKSVRHGLDSALRGAVEMIFAARDFNITPLLISQKFRCETDTIRFPSYKQRYEITSREASETATCAAVVNRKSFYSYAMVVEKARYLYRAVTSCVILSVVCSLMGVLFEFVMALLGAGAAISVGKLLVFMLLWLVPTLAITVSITK